MEKLKFNNREIVLVVIGREIIPMPCYEEPKNRFRLHPCYTIKPLILIHASTKHFSIN